MNTTSYAKLSHIPISAQTLVLTANQRLALRLIEAYDETCHNKGLKSWPSAAVFSLSHWLQLQTSQHIAKQVLTPAQENYLWEQIIKFNCDDIELINPAETATQARQAFQTLTLWNLDRSCLASHENHEVQLFYQWSHQFDDLCQRRDWVTEAACCQQLMQIDDFQSASHFTELLLLGFDELPPLIDLFFQKLSDSISIQFVQIQKPASSIHVASLHDQKSEIAAMAQWAKSRLEENSKAKIGCICPQLERLRHVLFAQFTDILNPELILPNERQQQKLFNISAGQMFGLYPIVDTAVSSLNWLNGKIDMATFGFKIQSPYLHQHPLEQDIAAELDYRLRELDDLELPLTAVFQTNLSTSIEERSSHRNLIARFHDFHRFAQSLPDKATLASWKHYFIKALGLLGWPGFRTLSSDDYQLVVRFHALLEEFTAYACVCEELITLNEALYLLQKLITSTIFQVEGSIAPIQILGTLEASGNNFDDMWVMGMDDESWPPAPQPNPFIPYELQKEQHMPHATAERELIYTQQTMQRLLNSADTILFSHAHFEGDKEKSPSPLIADYPAYDYIHKPIIQPSTATLEIIKDDTAPEILENESIKGGTWIIKQQSECPFKAFANIRLKANQPQQPHFGLPPHQRGTLVHDTLDRVWQQLKTQQNLLSKSSESLDTLINNSIDAAVKSTDTSHQSHFKKGLLQLEQQRIHKLINEWLDYEKKRPPFEVLATEHAQKITISKLSFQVRIDRIDTLNDNRTLIIDYKTNTQSINGWFGDRPSDPQLPIYLLLQPNANALCYGEVKPQNCRFKGLVDSEERTHYVPDLTDIGKFSKQQLNWQDQIHNWKTNITQLVAEFESGQAAVCPTNPATSCLYCDLQPLCRVEIA